MRLGFVVNDLRTEQATYTTTRLALTATRLGHEVWMLGVSDFIYDPDDSIHALARRAPHADYEGESDYLADLQGPEARRDRITVDDLDVLWLRNDPAPDATERPWATTSGILFGQLAADRGVIVLNDPGGLLHAINKTYLQHFPHRVRPRACISRDPDEIKAFIDAQHGTVVLKPLQGSGGQSVFLVRQEDRPNLNQMIEAIVRDGYCVAQEYLPAAAEGDVRLFVMNGRPLESGGKYAAFRRVNKSGDARSNMKVGGVSEAAEIDDRTLELVSAVRPRLLEDGFFLVGLDIVGDKLMEVNVFSPGGLGSARRVTGVDFTEVVIRDLERKCRLKTQDVGRIPNARMATL